MSQPLVSVVIPAYNYGRFVGESIQSVLNQTYSPIEVIVVDDGSTDNTRSAVTQFPVTLLAGDHLGVCAAVNKGFRASSGAFFMRLDADDVVAPTYVERMVAALNEHPEAALAYSHGEYFGALRGPFPLEPFGAEALAEGAYVTSLAVIRREAFERAGLYDVDMASVRCEDWDLWLTLAEAGCGGILVPEVLWKYRRHPHQSRNTWDLVSFAGIHRELRLIARLQDKHARLFAKAALLRRLVSLVPRLARREVRPRKALLLVLFYGVMLTRLPVNFGRSRRRRTI